METRFENYNSEAMHDFSVTGWYGSHGFSFADPETAFLYKSALRAVANVANVTIDYNSETRIYIVWCEPKTALASAMVSALVDSFKLS